MEENKIDPYQIIGFVLLIAAFFWWFNYTIPELEKNSLESDKIEKATGVSTDEIKIKTQNDDLSIDIDSSNSVINNQNLIQDTKIIIVENDDLLLKFSSKGGLLIEALLKNFSDYKGDPLYMIKDGNQNLNLNFKTISGQKN